MSAVVTIVIAVIVFLVAAFASHAVPQPMRAAHPWVPQAVIKPLLIAISLGLMFAMRRPLADFGFRRATRGSKRWIAAGLGLGALATILALALGLEGLQKVMKGYTLPMIILWVWIVSSVSEEIFVRGWFQSALSMGGMPQRAAVILSGAFFGAMHLSLLVAGVEYASVAMIVTWTLLLGLICAHLRATRESLLPPILVHVAFNIGGLLGGILYIVTTKIG